MLLPLLLAACGAPPPPVHHASKGILFSPNGEPLDGGPLGSLSCEEAMSLWFARVDGNGDGAIDRQEFLADAKAQFARMDLDHDGFITSQELWTTRQPYLPTPPRSAKAGEGGNRVRHDRNESPIHAVAPGSADPVMSADANLDFRVSLGEFTAQADSVFASFDTDRNGRLSLAEIKAHGCAPQPNRPVPVE